jgi:hypothetical protein
VPYRPPRGPRLDVPGDARVLVPVLSPAGGGCRSTVSALLGLTFAPLARTAVLDASCPVLSPWSSWATPAAGEVASSGHGTITTCAELDRACGTQRLGSVGWQILCLEGRHSGTGDPSPEEFVRLSGLGGWAVTVVDTGHSALRDLAGGPDPVWSTTSAWFEDTPSTPVLSVPNTCQGLDYAHRFVTAALRQGLGCDRLTVAVVDTAPGPAPRRALAALTVLAGRVRALVRLPFDRQIREHQMTQPARLTRSTRRAGRALAAAVLAAGAGPPGTRPRASRQTPTSCDEWTPCDQR